MSARPATTIRRTAFVLGFVAAFVAGFASACTEAPPAVLDGADVEAGVERDGADLPDVRVGSGPDARADVPTNQDAPVDAAPEGDATAVDAAGADARATDALAADVLPLPSDGGACGNGVCSFAESCLACPQDCGSCAGASGFVRIGAHPQAVAQPTAVGRVLTTLEPWHGRLYAGYGDYTANTGPIAIAPFDPVGAVFPGTGHFSTVFTLATEAIYVYRAIGARLFAPAYDPREQSDFAVGDLAAGAPWQAVGGLETTHAFDMATLDGADLWLVGSKGSLATVFRSQDGGLGWQLELSVPPLSTAPSDYARFYFAGVLGGKLYVQARDVSVTQPSSRVFDGVAWSTGPSLQAICGHKPVPFGGALVYQSGCAGWAGALRAFDGTRVVRIAEAVRDHAVIGGVLYALHADGRIRRAMTLDAWTDVTVAPAEATSLAALDGTIYVGTSAGEIWRQPAP